MIYMYLVNVTITNKVLYEALRDCYKMGFFREKADVAFESFADELTPVISRSSADEYTLKFSYTHTGNMKIVPQVPCDVLPCLLIQLRNLFAFTEEGFETFKTFLLERRREIDLSYDYVCWHIGNSYINEEPHRVDEYFYIDREKKKFWTTVEKYTGDISLNMGLATDQKDYEAELAKSEYSKNIADYPQNKMYGDPFAKVAIDLDKDVEIVDDKAPVKKEKSDDPIKTLIFPTSVK